MKNMIRSCSLTNVPQDIDNLILDIKAYVLNYLSDEDVTSILGIADCNAKNIQSTIGFILNHQSKDIISCADKYSCFCNSCGNPIWCHSPLGGCEYNFKCYKNNSICPYPPIDGCDKYGLHCGICTIDQCPYNPMN
jgi:hypothetical protein